MKQKYLKIMRLIIITALPLLICILIPLLSMIFYDISKGMLQKEIISDFVESLKHAVFHSPPFFVISLYAYYLIRKDRRAKEIAIKMSCMLTPITLFSFYWYAKTFPDPLALGFLLFINLFILVPAWFVGLTVSSAFKDTRNK